MRKLVVGLALASTALASPALAKDDTWYVGVEGGATIFEDTNFDINNVDNTASFGTDVGYTFGGIVGYDFGPFRLEADVNYSKVDADDFNTLTPVYNGPAAPSLVAQTKHVATLKISLSC